MYIYIIYNGGCSSTKSPVSNNNNNNNHDNNNKRVAVWSTQATTGEDTAHPIVYIRCAGSGVARSRLSRGRHLNGRRRRDDGWRTDGFSAHKINIYRARKDRTLRCLIIIVRWLAGTRRARIYTPRDILDRDGFFALLSRRKSGGFTRRCTTGAVLYCSCRNAFSLPRDQMLRFDVVGE